MTKHEMLQVKHWNLFNKYPELGSDIVLHLIGHKSGTTIYLHQFEKIEMFDPRMFDMRDYYANSPEKTKGTTWKAEWLPVSALVKTFDNTEDNESTQTDRRHYRRSER